jgi:hypothetical protein
MQGTNFRTTAIRFTIGDSDSPTDIVLEGELADFFVNVIIASELSKYGILQALDDLSKSQDTTLAKTNKNLIRTDLPLTATKPLAAYLS